MNFRNLVLSLFISIFLFSCSDDNGTETKTIIPYTNSIGELMLVISAGTFQMGNTGAAMYDSQDNYLTNDSIVHSVKISKSFHLSQYEVTQAQYSTVMLTNPSHFIGDDFPVEQVSWYDAVAFCNMLSTEEGLTQCYSGSGDNIVCNFSANGYRLPTEAEWEYACKGGTTTDLYSGNITYYGYGTPLDTNLNKIGWYWGNSASTTHPVGQKAANNYGLCDMNGNVWEWCWDWYSAEYSKTAETDPKGPTSGDSRVVRGGSCYYYAYNCRSSSRFYYDQSTKYYSVGFRIARTY